VSCRNSVTIKRFAINDASNQAMDAIKHDTFVGQELPANDSELLVCRMLNASKLDLDHQRYLMRRGGYCLIDRVFNER
jgi:hypothetical protein